MGELVDRVDVVVDAATAEVVVILILVVEVRMVVLNDDDDDDDDNDSLDDELVLTLPWDGERVNDVDEVEAEPEVPTRAWEV